MPTNQICSECGAPIPTDARHGLCPSCVFGLLDSAPAPDTSTAPLTPASTARLPAESLAPAGTRFGDYELLEEIARGGMGVVYKARQRSLNRVVAVKMVLFGKFAGRGAFERFRGEAQAAASLRHPHIVAIHEIGQLDGQPFYAMDYVEGRSLAAEIEDGKWKMNADFANHASRLTPSTPTIQQQGSSICRLLITLCEAVHHAHERGVLHRDLKPSNILLDVSGQPHLTDFGLARRLQEESDLTQTGQTLGSPNYMPPEQASGQHDQVSVRSDVYALGAILYHLLTGRPLFGGADVTNLLRAVREDEPVRPRQLNPSIPADLETICLKCLEKEPGKRYATAQELADDLSRFLGNEPILARPVSRFERGWRWCQRKPALAGSLAAAAILLLAVLIGSPIAIYRINQARNAEAVERRRAQTETTRAEAEALKARQLTYASDMNRAQQAVQADELDQALQLLNRHRPEFVVPASAGSASDRSLASSDRLKAGLQTDLRGWEWRYLWRQCRGEQRFILGQHTSGVSALGMLADGKQVFSAGRDRFVRLWDLESRRQIGLLPHSEEVIGAAASRDGRWLATATEKEADGQPVLLWDLAKQEIAATLTTNFWHRPGSIAFSPDSKWIAFATVFSGVRLWDVNGRSEATNLPAITDVSIGRLGLAFSPDSRTLAYNENEYGTIRLWDIASRSEIGRLNGHHSFVPAIAFSPDGQTLASGSDDRTARLWNLAERREAFQFTNHSGGFTSLAFSPDGRTLALSGVGGVGRIVRLVDVATGSPRADLRGHLEDISGLAFTSDGQTLLSASDDGTIRVWDLAPHAKEKSAHPFARNSISVAWSNYGPALCLSPDGRHLLTLYTNQTFSLWDTLRLAEGERHPLPFTNTTMAAVAPDGRLAAFGNWRGEVMLWDAGTGQARFFARPVTNRIHRLVFSLGGRYLAVADDTRIPSDMAGSDEDPRRTVRVWDVGAQKEMRVFPNGAYLWSLKFSADSKELIAGTHKGSVKLWQLDGPAEAVTFPAHSGLVRGLVLRLDGQTLVSAGPDIIRFWDLRTRREIDKLNPKTGWLSGMALSPDGRRLANGASDGRITIWDVASHQEVVTLEEHQEEVTQLAFTDDGDHLVSASKDQLRVWRALSWAEIDAAEKEARK